MAEAGCNVILHSRAKEHTDKLSEELKRLGVEVRCVEAELGNLQEVEDMLREIDNFKVNVEIVLNNAGLQIAYRDNYLETPMSDYDISFKVNTMAPMMIVYHFLPKMIAAGWGRIVNTTSGIALDPQQAGYSASKAALDKVTIDVASKLDGTDVMINLADPGWCRTELGGNRAPNSPESALPGILLGAFLDDKKSGRIIRAQEYAGMTMEEAIKAVVI